MPIDLGTLGTMSGAFAGPDEIRCIFQGNSAIFVSNAPPTQHVISSNTPGSAVANADVIFTSTVTDDNLAGGTYQWTAGGTNVGTNSNQYTHSAAGGSTVAIQCTFTDAGGLSLASNIINQAWALPARPNPWSRFNAGAHQFTWTGGGTASISFPNAVGYTFGNQGSTGLPNNGDFAGPGTNGVVSSTATTGGYTSGGRIDTNAAGGTVTINLPASGGFAAGSFSQDITS